MWASAPLATGVPIGEIVDDAAKAVAALGIAVTGAFAYLNHRNLKPVNGTKGDTARAKRLRKGRPNIADVLLATTEKIDAVVAETQGAAAHREEQARAERAAILAALARIEEKVGGSG